MGRNVSDLDLLNQSLARNVKHWRSVRGFTLDVLAARAAVSRGMLIQIEQARTNPSIGTVVKIGDALGVSITTLLDYEQGPKVRIVPAERAVRQRGAFLAYCHVGLGRASQENGIQPSSQRRRRQVCCWRG